MNDERLNKLDQECLKLRAENEQLRNLKESGVADPNDV